MKVLLNGGVSLLSGIAPVLISLKFGVAKLSALYFLHAFPKLSIYFVS